MESPRMRRRLGLLSLLSGAVLLANGCFSTELVGQVFADQVAFTAATFVRAVVDSIFGAVFP